MQNFIEIGEKYRINSLLSNLNQELESKSIILKTEEAKKLIKDIINYLDNILHNVELENELELLNNLKENLENNIINRNIKAASDHISKFLDNILLYLNDRYNNLTNKKTK